MELIPFNNDDVHQLTSYLLQALSIASDHAISIQGCFSKNLKKYKERKPMLQKYFSAIRKFIQLHPNTADEFIRSKNWNILCKILEQLENGSRVHRWAKNDDKLSLLRLMIAFIRKYHVKPQRLFNKKLIHVLSTQFLISTRSTIVSSHIEQTISITFQLLAYFAHDVTHVSHTKKNWITDQVLNKHLLLWIISSVVIPHNMYNSDVAASSVLEFIAKVIDFKCTQSASKWITKTFHTLKQYEGPQTYKDLSTYPRNHVLLLLSLILRTKTNHALLCLSSSSFIRFISRWIRNFVFTPFLTEKERIKTFNILLNFIELHTKFMIKNNMLIPQLIQYYITAIATMFLYYIHNIKKCRTFWSQGKLKLCWNNIHLLISDNQHLQDIFDSSVHLCVCQMTFNRRDIICSLINVTRKYDIAHNSVLQNIIRGNMCENYIICGKYKKALKQYKLINTKYDVVRIQKLYAFLLIVYFAMRNMSEMKKILYLMEEHEYIQHKQMNIYWISKMRVCLFNKRYQEAITIHRNALRLNRYSLQMRIAIESELYSSFKCHKIDICNSKYVVDRCQSIISKSSDICTQYSLYIFVNKCRNCLPFNDKLELLSSLRFVRWFAFGTFIVGKLSYECGKYILAKQLILRACKTTPELPMIKKYGDRWKERVVNKVNNLQCSYCGTKDIALKSCEGCCATQYCSRLCQKKAWKMWHRNTCDKKMKQFVAQRKHTNEPSLDQILHPSDLLCIQSKSTKS